MFVGRRLPGQQLLSQFASTVDQFLGTEVWFRRCDRYIGAGNRLI